MRTSKILFFDTETTGLSEAAEIIQIAGIVISYPSLIQLDKFDIRMRPRYSHQVDPEALKTIGYTLEQIERWPSRKEGWSKLSSFLSTCVDPYDPGDKMYTGGWNTGFDMQMLTNNWQREQDQESSVYLGSFFNWRVFDVLQMVNYYEMVTGVGTFPSRKLEFFADLLHVSIQAHDALADIEANVEIFKMIEERIRQGDVVEWFANLIMQSRCTSLCAKRGTRQCQYKPGYRCMEPVKGGRTDERG